MNAVELNEEVLFTRDPITKVSASDIALLKTKASQNRRKRVRLCAHRSTSDRMHEMLIVHAKGTYVRPHKHINKAESVHVIEGAMTVVFFDDSGNVLEVVRLGEHASGRPFFYRLSESYYHTVIPTSDVVVFHEATSGPFDRKDNVPAPWSPAEDDERAMEKYMARLHELIALHDAG